ncbi:MAG TPA: NUDIX domain-containing protein [Alphaproteobacteria bacterium]|nr:NUDIX domain-containing protein [Alphaproteobacteria bacterium]
MNRDDVELVSRELLFQAHFRLEQYNLRHRLHAGGWSDVISRDMFERGSSAGVLPYDPERDAVVLIQQFRAGAYAAGCGPWLTEIVAGMIGDGETAEAVCHREAKEEAGLVLGELVPISTHLTTPGACSETVSLFCGRVDSSGAGGIHGLDHEHEDIRVIVVPAAEAFAMRRRNEEIHDSSTVACLLWLELNREELRRRWR